MARILSVGIDIGTSTTQIIFSHIRMENTGAYFAVPRVNIVEKEVVYVSDVYTTPLLDRVRIDGEAIREIVASEYAAARVAPSEVSTGAVIITGESARKENAAEVTKKLSDFAGDFVVSTAGPDLESVIAGKGSGAFHYSLEHHCVSVNLDIGGGTTNLVAFDDGEVAAKGCVDVGGRLVRIGEDNRITYVSEAVSRTAADLRVSIREGDRADVVLLSRVTDRMALLLTRLLSGEEDSLFDALKTPGSTVFRMPKKAVGAICFSGGVADMITDAFSQENLFPYGDIGALLGKSIAKSGLMQRFTVIRGAETIRATVVGAGTYTTTISGSTITYAAELFPVKNVPALKLTKREQEECFHALPGALSEKIRWFLAQSDEGRMILALPGRHDIAYPELKRLAAYLSSEMDEALPADSPVYLVIEQDMGKALGILMEKILKGRRRIACIDGIHVEQNDYVDMGKPLVNGLVIPVVVKTLVFGE